MKIILKQIQEALQSIYSKTKIEVFDLLVNICNFQKIILVRTASMTFNWIYQKNIF